MQPKTECRLEVRLIHNKSRAYRLFRGGLLDVTAELSADTDFPQQQHASITTSIPENLSLSLDCCPKSTHNGARPAHRISSTQINSASEASAPLQRPTQQQQQLQCLSSLFTSLSGALSMLLTLFPSNERGVRT